MNTGQNHLSVVEVTPGADGVLAVHDQLVRALETGSAIAPIPAVSKHFPTALVNSIRAAINPALPTRPHTIVALSTSGSTGNPRGVEFTADQLGALNEFINSGSVVGLQLDASPRWVAALPVTSVGGFNVLVRSIAAGAPPVALESVAGAGTFSAEEVTDALRNCGDSPAMISLVPAQLRRLLSTEEGTQALSRFAAVLVGGSATSLSDQIHARDQGIAIAFTYGMTETSGGCVFNGVPAPGVAIDIDSITGVISITGKVIATGYRPSGSALNDELFRGGFTTQDLGELDNTGTLHISGRTDDIVIINGVNISVHAIKEIIDAHPLVQDSFVLPDLTAVVVPTGADLRFEDELRADISQRLGNVAVPRFMIVDSLPYLPNGKPDRQQIQTMAHPNPYG
jgi:O-succinylbenzoic acid--CoA ligase